MHRFRVRCSSRILEGRGARSAGLSRLVGAGGGQVLDGRVVVGGRLLDVKKPPTRPLE
jgi:hypothetical protein